MLALLCTILAIICWGIAVLAPSSPPFDRVRFIAAGLIAAWIPTLVHAAQTR